MSQNRVALDKFLQACECAWSYLEEDFESVESIRATCRDGRVLYDRHLEKLTPDLWDDTDGNYKPVPAEDLRKSMWNFVHRGAKPSCLDLRYYLPEMDHETDQGVSLWPPDVREQQLIAVLDGLSSCPQSSLELSGGIPHSKAVSKVVADRCPNLTKLSMYYDLDDLPSHAEEANGAYAAGVKSLVRRVGPRLRELTLTGARDWPAEGVCALRVCTALTSLYVHAEWTTGTFTEERRLLSTVAKLTQLRSLRLMLSLDPNRCTLNAMRRRATGPTRLSTLTALTSLQLQLPDCYEPAGDSWQRQQQDGQRHAAWEEVRETHRTALLFALRCMPHLQHLDCSGLWLRPSELASLTALASLTLGGLLPPEPQQPESISAAAPWTLLPAQLRTLTLASGASPGFLAAFQPPPSLKHFYVSRVHFGMQDVSPGCRLLPQVASDVSQAVVLLARAEPWTAAIVADCGALSMTPPGDAAAGHEEWIRGLRPLGTRLQHLTIKGVQLRVGDLVCLVSMLPNLTKLEISDAHVSLGALHAMTGLLQLKELTLDLTHFRRLTTEELADSLAFLCRDIATLRMATISTASVALDADACEQGVQEQLARWGSTRGRVVWIRETGGGDSDLEDGDTDSDFF